MSNFVRSSLAIVIGIAVVIAGLVAVEMFGAAVHPFPADFDSSSQQQMMDYVASYPSWILAIVVPVWGLVAWLGTWVAKRIGGTVSALVIGILLVAAVIFNVSMLPYPLWFKVLSVISVVSAVVLAFRKRREAVRADAQ